MMAAGAEPSEHAYLQQLVAESAVFIGITVRGLS